MKERLPARWRRWSLLQILVCLAVLSVAASAAAVTGILRRSTNPMFSLRQTMEVPELTGLTREEAAADAGALTLVWVERYHDAPAGQVVAQRPAAGTRVKEGQQLVVEVSLGEHLVTVPALTGLSRSEALDTLRAAGFATAVEFIRDDPTLPADTVIRTDPAGGTALEAGSVVTLTVARAVSDPFRPVPSLIGLSVAEARRQLAALDLLPTTSPANRQTGTVTAQDPLPGTLLRRNEHVRLTVTE